MEGATPAARRKTERGRFGANSFGTEPPRSLLGGFAARVAPVIRGESVGWREARTNADEHTLDRDRPDKRKGKHGTRDSQTRHTRLAGRGGKSPKPPLGKREAHSNAAEGNAAEPSLGRARHD